MTTMFDQVAEVIGKAAATKLRDAFPGQTLYIPRQSGDKTAKRNRRIRQLRNRKADPASITDLMSTFALSRRQIWNILKGDRN